MLRGRMSSRGRKELVDQLRAGWNPLVEWLRDVQAWSLAAEVAE